jgi:hypothetical protein
MIDAQFVGQMLGWDALCNPAQQEENRGTVVARRRALVARPCVEREVGRDPGRRDRSRVACARSPQRAFLRPSRVTSNASRRAATCFCARNGDSISPDRISSPRAIRAPAVRRSMQHDLTQSSRRIYRPGVFGAPAGHSPEHNRQMSHVDDRSAPQQCYPTHARIVG